MNVGVSTLFSASSADTGSRASELGWIFHYRRVLDSSSWVHSYTPLYFVPSGSFKILSPTLLLPCFIPKLRRSVLSVVGAMVNYPSALRHP
jgi:hypothetical protein